MMKILIKFLTGLSMLVWLVSLFSCKKPPDYYSADDYVKVPKIDAHFHCRYMDDRYAEFVRENNFRLISPNVDSGNPVDEQLEESEKILKKYPSLFAFLGTFSAEGYANENYVTDIIDQISGCMDRGASGIKIWKNIGMVITDSTGRYVMADDPVYEPVFSYLEKNKIPLLAHLGEPRNCWLPLEEMTDAGDRSYYRDHPQYHMYLHPDLPSYEDQIYARDHLLEKYPDMIFIGAHLGSLEWNVDELAKRLDRFPHFNVDMAARMGHLRNQSKQNPDQVRDFLIRYQDRILYATDLGIDAEDSTSFERTTHGIRNYWKTDWLYLATDSTLNEVKGLQLPKEVIDKIYYKNAEFLMNH